jgi:hypothetical protein
MAITAVLEIVVAGHAQIAAPQGALTLALSEGALVDIVALSRNRWS